MTDFRAEEVAKLNGVMFRIDIMPNPQTFGLPHHFKPDTFYWLDGDVEEFELALHSRSIEAYDLNGHLTKVATSRIYSWEANPNAEAIIETIRKYRKIA